MNSVPTPPLAAYILFLLLLLGPFAADAGARSLPIPNGGSLSIPDQVLITPEGVTFVRPGEAAPTTILWSQLDLPKLAQTDPELELGRRKAVLTGEKSQLGAAARLNPYAQFLNSPVKVTFRTKEVRQTKLQTTTVTAAVPALTAPALPLQEGSLGSAGTSPDSYSSRLLAGSARLAPAQPQLTEPPAQFVNNAVTTLSETTIDQTRAPLETTVGGLLELISDYHQVSSTGSLVRELREHPQVFANLLAQLRTLQKESPNDRNVIGTAEALQKLAKNGPVSMDAQMAIQRHLSVLRTRAEAR
jgi:hypothetical protein